MEILLGGAALLIAWHFASCFVHPYKDCRSCNRSGESRSTSHKGAFGACRRCKGTGRRRRIGARLIGRK